MKVEYDLAAARDLNRIRAHIAQERPVAAERMYQRLLAACEALADFPRKARPSPRARLRELTTVHPYIITYVVGAEVIRIRRIVHGARLR